MKAVLALIAIYVATFIIATQGASQNPVQASPPSDNISASSKSIDPAKAADLRTLLEFVGARDQLKAVANDSAAQYREKLRSGAPAVLNASNTTDRQTLDQGRREHLSEQLRSATRPAADNGYLRQALQ